MNIFVVDLDPVQAAKDLPDKLVGRMALESCQMFSSWAFNTHGIRLVKKDGTLYGTKGHSNHPCTKWLYESPANVSWLLHHAIAHCEEHTARRKTIHACEKTLRGLIDDLSKEQDPLAVDFTSVTPFVLCMPEQYKNPADPVESYRNFLMGDKGYAEWNYCSPPSWWNHETHKPAREKWLAEKMRKAALRKHANKEPKNPS